MSTAEHMAPADAEESGRPSSQQGWHWPSEISSGKRCLAKYCVWSTSWDFGPARFANHFCWGRKAVSISRQLAEPNSLRFHGRIFNNDNCSSQSEGVLIDWNSNVVCMVSAGYKQLAGLKKQVAGWMFSEATPRVLSANVSHVVKRGWWFDARICVCNILYLGTFTNTEIWYTHTRIYIYNIHSIYTDVDAYMCVWVCAFHVHAGTIIHHLHQCVCGCVCVRPVFLEVEYGASTLSWRCISDAEENHLMILCSFFFVIVILVPMTFICYYQNSRNFAVNGAPWHKWLLNT